MGMENLIILLIFSSRTVSSSELVYDNFHEVPLFVLNNRTSGTPFNFIPISFSRVLNICFVLIVKASIMIQCGDVEQNPGAVLKYAECVKTVGASLKNNVNIFSLNCRSIVGQNSTLKQLMHDLGKTQFLALQKHGSKWITISVFGKYAVKISNVSEKIGIFHYMTKKWRWSAALYT